MMVTHFNRGPRPGNYTFEQLFNCIRAELEKKIQVVSYSSPAHLSRLQCTLWAQKRAGAINHITGDVNYLAFALPPEKTIITVHDIGHYSETLKGWKKYVYKKVWLDLPFKRVKYLTAISEFTKKELVSHLDIPAEKITVIPNPVLPGIEFTPKAKLNSKPVILQVGSGHNKNVERLIDAVTGLDVKLLLVNKLYDEKIKSKLLASGVEYEQRTDLDFEGLKQAYIDCDILYFASVYEGFGMPITEAQATGRPVITSNLASMPEAAGNDGAMLVDPYNVDEIRAAIIKLTSDRNAYDEYVKNGLENVKRFSAEKIAEAYIDLYKRIAEN